VDVLEVVDERDEPAGVVGARLARFGRGVDHHPADHPQLQVGVGGPASQHGKRGVGVDAVVAISTPLACSITGIDSRRCRMSARSCAIAA